MVFLFLFSATAILLLLIFQEVVLVIIFIIFIATFFLLVILATTLESKSLPVLGFSGLGDDTSREMRNQVFRKCPDLNEMGRGGEALPT